MSEPDDEVTAELRRAVTRLYSRFRSERTDGEVPEAALLVLVLLDKRAPMSLSDLAGAARVTSGSMGQTVHRLERLGHVSKTPGTRDRRTRLFALTDAGRAAVAASRSHRHTWLSGRVARLTDAEQDVLVRAAPLLLRIADS